MPTASASRWTASRATRSWRCAWTPRRWRWRPRAGTRAQTAPFLGEARTIGAKLIARPGSLEARFRMRTEDEVDPEDLPLAEGSASPSVVERPEEAGHRGARPGAAAAVPAGRGGRAGNAALRGTGGHRVHARLRQAAARRRRRSASSPGAGYALRAEVRDPAAMKRTLANIARQAADAARRLQGDVISITPPRDGGGVYLLDRIGADCRLRPVRGHAGVRQQPSPGAWRWRERRRARSRAPGARWW